MKMVKTPSTGGDTLFASCYGAYDRLSEPWQRMADSLSCTSVDAYRRQKLTGNAMKLHIMSRTLCRLQTKESSFGWGPVAILTMLVATLKQGSKAQALAQPFCVCKSEFERSAGSDKSRHWLESTMGFQSHFDAC